MSFTRCPDDLLDDLEAGALRDIDVLVYLAIAKHADPRGLCWPSHGTIARIVGRSRHTSMRATKRLAARGWLRITRQPEGSDGRHKSNSYTVLAKRDHVAPVRHGDVAPVRPDHVAPVRHELDPSNETQGTTTPAAPEQLTMFDAEVMCPECGQRPCTIAPRGEVNPMCRECWRACSHPAVALMAHADKLAHEQNPETTAARAAIEAAPFAKAAP